MTNPLNASCVVRRASCVMRRAVLVLFLTVGLLVFLTSLLSAFQSEPPQVVKKGAFQSVKTGDWTDQTCWDPIGVPDTGDTATVNNGHTITVKGALKCGNVTINAGGTLALDCTAGNASLTIDSGSLIQNNGTFVFGPSGYVGANSDTLNSAGWVIMQGTGAITWNNHPNIQLGGIGWAMAFSPGTSKITLIQGGLSVTGGVMTIGNDFKVVTQTLYAWSGITITAGTMSVTGGTINCYGGSFGFTANSTARLTLDQGSKVYFNPPSDGLYGFNLIDGGQISATGTAANRVSIASNSAYKTYILLKKDINPGTPAALFSYCDISGCGVSATDKWGITAYDVNGSDDNGLATVGLTVDNCLIHDGGAWAVVLNFISTGCLNNHITNNTMYNLSTGGIYVAFNTPSGSNGHLIGGNTIYGCLMGMQFVGGNGAASSVFSTNPITNTTIYNCTDGLNFDWGTCGGSYSNEQLFRNCNFGTLGQNSSADIAFDDFFQTGRTVPNGVRLENCVMGSPTEVKTNGIYVNDDRIVSYKHNGVPGLVRVWGDWRPTAGAAQIIKIRYDSELVTGVTGDANTQKIVEFGPCSATMPAAGATSPYKTPAGSSQFRTSNTQSGCGIEFVGITSPNWAPVIVRSIGSNTYSILIESSGAPNQGQLRAYATQFQNLAISGTMIATTGALSPTTDGFASLNYCSFNNNTGATQHLAVGSGWVFTRTNCTFDDSTAYNVRVDNATQIYFTNYTNLRAVNAPQHTYDLSGDNWVSTNVFWDSGGVQTTLYTNINPANWNAGGSWFIDPACTTAAFAFPGINTTAVLTGSALVNLNVSGSCKSLIITPTATLTFNTAGVSLTIANGGVISNSGTINATSGITMTAQSLAGVPFVFEGVRPTWAAQTYGIANADWRTPITTVAGSNFGFAGNMLTKDVWVVAGAGLTYYGGGAAISWTNNGGVWVGNGAGSTGTLQLQPATMLNILCPASSGQYGLVVDSGSTLTATGTSNASRDCKITSASVNKSYIYCKPGSLSKFQYCEIYNLGYNSTGWDTPAPVKYGLEAENINGANPGEGFTVNSCTIHDNFCNIFLTGTNNNAANGKGITNNTLYNGYVSLALGKTIVSATNLTVSGNTIRDSTIGLVLRPAANCQFQNNTIYNMQWMALYLAGNVQNCSFQSESYYNTGLDRVPTNGDGAVRVASGWANQMNMTNNVFTSCNFGTLGSNFPADIDVSNALANALYTLSFYNCQFASATDVYYQAAMPVPAAGSYLISYLHNQQAGKVKIWGDYLRSAGTENWNFTNPTYAGGADGNTAKTVTFGPGAPGLNGGRSRARFDAASTIDMLTGNSALNKTTVQGATGATYYDFIVTGTLKANYDNISQLASDGVTTYGLELYGAANTINLSNTNFANCDASGGPFLYFKNTLAFNGPLTTTGCSFDSSTFYNVWCNIGAGQYITMTNFTKYPGNPDYNISGEVDWLSPNWVTVQDGNWWAPQTWNNGTVPPDWATVTVNNAVVVTGGATGFVKTRNLTVNAGGGLGFNGTLAAVTLTIDQSSTLTNNASISVTNSTFPVQITSSGGLLFNYSGNPISFTGNNTLNIGMCNYQNPVTVPANFTLNITGEFRSLTTTIQTGGQILFQSAGREWDVNGSILVGQAGVGAKGNLKLGANTLTRVICPNANGQYGIIVNSTGYLEAIGTSSAARDCIISNGGLGGFKPYIYFQSGSQGNFQFATIANVGGPTPNPWGAHAAIVASNVNGNVAGQGLTINTCNIYGASYIAVYLNTSTYNTVINNNIYNNNVGIICDGVTSNNTINNNNVYSNTGSGVSVGWGAPNQTFTNMYISDNPTGIVVTNGTAGTVDQGTFINSIISGNSTADVSLQSGNPATAQQRLVLQNCILGSTTQVSNTIDKAGDWVLSQKHGQVAGRSVIWGDYQVAGVYKLNYADETYPGAGDAGVQKTLYLGKCIVAATGNLSVLEVLNTGTLQMNGGTGSSQSIQVYNYITNGAASFYCLSVSGTINANNVVISGANTYGIFLPQSAQIDQLNSISFTNMYSTGAIDLYVQTGQDKTLNGCWFDASNSTGKDVYADWNGVAPTTVRLTNYTHTSTAPGPGGRDTAMNNSQVIWQEGIGCLSLNRSSSISTTAQGSTDVAVEFFRLGPISPTGAVANQPLVSQVVITLTGSAGATWTDVAPGTVRIYRDTDNDMALQTATDPLIGGPLTFTNWGPLTFTLTTPQTVSGSGGFYLVWNISPTAGVGHVVGAQIMGWTLTIPTYISSTAGGGGVALPSGTSALTLSANTGLMDGMIRTMVPTTGTYVGTNIFNTTALNQSVSTNAVNNSVTSYYIRIQNDSSGADGFSILQSGNPVTSGAGTWVISYYDVTTPGGRTDITSQMTGGSIYSTNSTMAPGAIWEIEADISATAAAVGATEQVSVVVRPWSINNQDKVNYTTIIQPYQTDLLVKPLGGVYLGSNVFDPPNTQSITATINTNTLVTYYIMVQNDGGAQDQFTITGTAASALGGGWSVSYYDNTGGAGNITNSITNGLGWLTPVVTSTGNTVVRLEIMAANTITGGGGTYTFTIYGQSKGMPGMQDQVKLVLTPQRTYQPDALIKLGTEADAAYIGKNIYENPPSAAQQKTSTINAGGITSYYVRLMNEGNATDNFTVSGSGNANSLLNDSGTWFVSYYYPAGADITSEIANNRWLSPPVPVGGQIDVNVVVQNSGAIGNIKNVYLTAISYNNPVLSDTVWSTTTAGKLQQPDVVLVTQGGLPLSGSRGFYETSLTPSVQVVTQTTNGPVEVTYYIQIWNDSINLDTYSITGTTPASLGAGWYLTYYDSITRANNITAQMTNIGVGYSSGLLATNGLITITAVVSYNPLQVGPNLAKNIYIYANSTANPTMRDGVDGVVTTAYYQPDLVARKGAWGAPWDVGLTAYYPTAQALSTIIDNGTPVTYYYQIQNDGNYTGNYSVTGTAGTFAIAGGGTATISYYYDATGSGWNAGDPDITNQITPTGWTTGNIVSGTGNAQLVQVITVKGANRLAVFNGELWATRLLDTKETDRITTAYYVPGADLQIGQNSAGPFLGGGVYELAPAAQITSTVTTLNNITTYYIYLQNNAAISDTLKITATATSGAGWWITYYNAFAGFNQALGITTTGYTTPLLVSGASAGIRMELSFDSTVAINQTKAITFYGFSTAGGSWYDSCAAQTKSATYQPDVAVKPAGGAYSGVHYYSLTPANTSLLAGIANGTVVTYYYQITNDGSYNTPGYTITADAGQIGNWWVSYYWGTSDTYAGTPNSIPSSGPNAITPTGWYTSVITATTGVNYLRVNIQNNGAPSGNSQPMRLYATNMPTSETDTAQVLAQVPGTDALVGASYDPSITAGTWFTKGVYNSTLPTNQMVTQVAATNVMLTYYVMMNNDAGTPDTFTVTGTGGGNGWWVTYYDSPISMNNITNQVAPPGTGWPSPSVVSTTIRFNISFDASVPASTTRTTYVLVKGSLPGSQDLVGASAVSAYYKPNLMSRKSLAGPPWDIGSTSYYPTTQTQSTLVENNQPVTYYYRLQNDGNYTGNYSVTGTAGTFAVGTGTWTVSYYYDPTGTGWAPGDPDITGQITPTGWTTGNVVSGTGVQLICVVKPSGANRGDQIVNAELWATRTIETQETDRITTTYHVPKADAMISLDDTTWLGTNTFAPAGQITSTVTGGLIPVTYYIRVQNDSAQNDSFSITAAEKSGAGWWITYYNADIGGMSIDLTGPNGWPTTILAAGVSTTIRANICYDPTIVGINQTKTITFYAFSTTSASGGSGFYDSVAGWTTTGSYKPDVAVKPAGGAYTGVGVYSAIPANQNITVSVQNGVVATYYYQLQNEGTYNSPGYTITADAGQIGNWWVSYYWGTSDTYAGTPNSIPSSGPNAITPTGWFSGAITATGGAQYLRVNTYVTGVPAGTTQVFRLWDKSSTTNEIDTAQITAQTPGTDALIGSVYNPDPTAPTWTGLSVYFPTTQVVTQVAESKVTLTYYVMMKNDTGSPDTFTVTGTASSVGWTVTYYDSPISMNNITNQVAPPGTGWVSPSVVSTTIRFNITYDSALVPVSTTQTTYVMVKGSSGSQDLVGAATTSASYQPDLWAKIAGGGWVGVGGWSANPANLPQSTTITNGGIATYYYRILNDGNYRTLGYSVTGDGSAGLWWITYYDDGALLENIADDTPVTGTAGAGAITGQGWNTGLINSGQYKQLRVNISAPTAPGSASQTFRLWVTATATGEADAGQITVTIQPSYTMDVQYRAATGTYTAATKGVYEPPPQNDVSQDLFTNRSAWVTYYVRLDNEGNSDAIYTVTGAVNQQSPGWTVSYYAPPYGAANDISQAVITGTGWVTPSISRAITYGGAANTLDLMVAMAPGYYTLGASKCGLTTRARYTDSGPADSVVMSTTINTAFLPDGLVRWLPNGSYTGEFVINTDGSGGNNVATSTNRTVGAKYVIRIENEANANDQFTITGTSSAQLGAGWTVSYYKTASYLPGDDITSQVIGIAGYLSTTALSLNTQADWVWAWVTPDKTVPGGQIVTATVTATSYGNGSKKDVVSLTTTCNKTYQVDALVQKQGSGWVGEDIYSPTSQIADGAFNNRDMITYYITVDNEGNTTESITITGVGSNANWTVSYYDNTGTGRTDISQSVITGTGYTVSLAMNTALTQTGRTVWLEMQALSYTAGGNVLACNVTALEEQGNPNQQTDIITARGTVNNIYQPDVMVKLDGEADGLYNQDGQPPADWGNPLCYESYPPTNQVRGKSGDNVNYVTYYIKLENDGNTDDTISISGTGTWVGPYATITGTWGTVTYYDVTAGEPGTDITQAVIQGGASAKWPLTKFQSLPNPFRLIKMIVRPYNLSSGQAIGYVVAQGTAGAPQDAVKTITQYLKVYQPDLYIKEAGGTYYRQGPPYYSDGGADDQTKSVSINNRGDLVNVATYYITVRNDGSTSPDSITVQQINAVPAGWYVSYYNLNLETDIPGTPNYLITATGSSYSLVTGATKLFRLVVTIDNTVSGGSSFTAKIKATSSNTGFYDQVNAQTTNTSTRRPDILISNTITTTGLHVYEPNLPADPWNLAQRQEIDLVGAGTTATYYLTVANDGNVTENILVSGYGGSAQWVVSYYNDADKDGVYQAGIDPDITASVTGTGWTAAAVAPSVGGDFRGVFMVVTPNNPGNGTNYLAVAQLTSSGDGTKRDFCVGKTVVNYTVYRSDIMVKQSSSYVGAYIYETPPITQQVYALSGTRDNTTTYYFRLQNDGNVPDTLSVTGTAGDGTNWIVSYYWDVNNNEILDGGDINITNQVIGGGYNFGGQIGTGITRTVIAQVFPRWGLVSGTSLALSVGVTSWGNGSQDIALVTTTVAAGFQPDNWIKNVSDAVYIGDNQYAIARYVAPFLDQGRFGVTQAVAQTITETSRTVTYYVTIENDGNRSDSMTVSGTLAQGPDWFITYYNSAGTPITANIVNGTWNTGSLAIGQSVSITMAVTARVGLAGGSVITASVTSTSLGDYTHYDTVQTVTNVQTFSKPNNLIKVAGGVYVGGNVYNLDGTNQTVTATADTVLTPTVTYYVQLRNDGNQGETFTITATAVGGYWVTFYDVVDDNDATPGAVISVGSLISPTSLASAQSKYLRIRVSPDPTQVYGSNQQVITFTTSSLSGTPDVVKEVTVVNSRYQPISLLTSDGYGDPSQRGTYTTKITSTGIANLSTITYYVWLDNEGNTNESNYTVTGSSASVGWVVSYYDGVSGEDDSITTAVKNGSFNPGNPTMSPYAVTGYKRIIRMRVSATNSLNGNDSAVFSCRVTDSKGNTDSVAVTATVTVVYQVNASIGTVSGGPYIGTTVYTPPTPLDPNQAISQTVATGAVVTYYIRLVNEGNVADTFSVSAPASGTGWWITYYNVTDGTTPLGITTTGWAGVFARNTSKEFSVAVTPDPSVDGAGMLPITVTVTSKGAPLPLQNKQSDSVLAKTTVTAAYQPDLSISLDNVIFDGVGVFSPTAQVKSGAVLNGVLVTYYIRLQNDGNLAQAFTVSATLPGAPGWNVQFNYNATPITLPWVSPVITKSGGTINLSIMVTPVGLPNGATGDVVLSAVSSLNPSLTDAVDARAIVSAANILYPIDNKNVSQTPVLIGSAAPNAAIEIFDITGGLPGTSVTTTTADANGNWRVKVPTLSVGGHILKPIANVTVQGQPRVITANVVAPVTVPVITYPTENLELAGQTRPAIRGNAGVANAGQVITATVNTNTSPNTYAYDMNIGTAVVVSDGSYTIIPSKSLPRGIRQIALVCNGVTSDLRTVRLVDPVGRFFDSVTNQPVNGMTARLERRVPTSSTSSAGFALCPVGGNPGEIGGPLGVTNPQVSGWTGNPGEYQFLLNQPAAGTPYEYRLVVNNISGYSFPSTLPQYQVATTTIITFPGDPITRTIYVDNNFPSTERNFSVGKFFYMDNTETDTIIADVPLDPTGDLLKITKVANKPEVSVGDILTYEVTINNPGVYTVTNVFIQDILPAGFKYLNGSAMMDDKTKLVDPTGGRTRLFNVGNILANSTKILRYQLVVGTAVTFGDYKNEAAAVYANGRVISNRAHATVKVIPDPLFDYGTIIGKVFDDLNGNGIQDENEPGVPGINIMTDDGIIVTTDRDGKYHLAGLKPETKLLKVDTSSLPPGTEFTTPNPAIVRFTLGGHLEKVNFGLRRPSKASDTGGQMVTVHIKVLPSKDGNPEITVAGIPVKLVFPPKPPEATKARHFRVMVETETLPDHLKNLTQRENGGYEGDYELPPGTTELKVWAENIWGSPADPKLVPISPPSLDVRVYRQEEAPRLVPELGLVMAPDILKIRAGRLEENAKFTITTNYQQFIKRWRIVVYEPVRGSAFLPEEEQERGPQVLLVDATGGASSEENDPLVAKDEVPQGYRVFYEKTGTRDDFGKEIVWEGKSNDKKRFLEMDKVYQYKLLVEGDDGRIDITRNGQIIVVSYWAEILRPAFNIQETIPGTKPIAALGPVPTAANIGTGGRVYLITGKTDKKNKIVISTPGLPRLVEVEPFEDGSFEKEIYIPTTEAKLLVEAKTPGAQSKVLTAEDIKVVEKQEKYFMLTGLGDFEFGSNSATGSLEAARHDVRLSNGSYMTGRASLFLKYKTEGGYTITSSFDSTREEKQLFRYVDPNQFYPFYGDNSIRADVADNTQGKFYLKAERGASNLVWGNWSTGFSGTELAQYNRTLYGAKLEVAQPFLPTTRATVIMGQAKQLASHNELRATGGSLYYLQDRYLIEGSEKVAVEVRDKITGLTLSSSTLSRGQDYDIDYKSGRVLFYKPIASVASSDLIVSTDLLAGNPVYITVDYEYDAWRNINNGISGARVIQPVGDDLTVGVTYVNQETPASGGQNYKLSAMDLAYRFAPYGQAAFEYASSQSESSAGFISDNGGLNFTSLPTLASDSGSAYKFNVSLDLSRTFANVPNDVLMTGFYQNIAKGFSSGQTVFQQGTTKYGFNVGAKLTQYDLLNIRYDGQQLDNGGNAASSAYAGADKTQVFNLQLAHSMDKLKLTGSYQYETTSNPVTSPLLRNGASQVLAARLDYQLTKEWTVSVEEQGVLAGKPNNQTTLGGALKLNNQDTLNLALATGNLGNSFLAGLTSQVDDKHSLYTKYAVSEDKAGNKSFSTIFGESRQATPDLKIYREERFNGRVSAENGQYAGLMGLDYTLNPNWSTNGSYEHNQINNVNGQLTSRDAAAAGFAYNSHPTQKDPTGIKGYTRFNTRFEYRLDKDTEKRTGILTANKLSYQFNEDATLLGRLNYSKTNNDSTGLVDAELTEATIGLAYRPVKQDKYNLLTKISYQTDRTPRSLAPMASALETAMILSMEGAMDVNKSIQLVGKLAYKDTTEQTGNAGSFNSTTYLIAPRLDYRISSENAWLNNWVAGVEYRMLVSKLAQDKKDGFVLELEKEITRYNLGNNTPMGVNFGFGYNFTNFSDDLSIYNDNYKVSGWFMRLSTKF